MDILKSFLFEWRYMVAVVLIVIVYAIFEWKSFKEKAYALMLQAKSLAKDEILNSGLEQENWVVNKIYQFAPKTITIFVNEYNMHILVHYLFHKAKDFLDNGEIDNSIE